MISSRHLLTLGDRLYDSQLLSLRCERAVGPGVSTLVVELPYPGGVATSVGDEVILELDAGDAGVPGASATWFTGTVTELRATPGGVAVRAGDASVALAGFRPTTTFEGQPAGDVIAGLCAAAGVETGQIEAGPDLPAYVADGWTTAWEHVSRLAAFSGATPTVSGQGAVQAVAEQPVLADVALRAGREILRVDVRDAGPPATGVRIAGEGPGPAGDRPGAFRFRASAPAGAGSPGSVTTVAALRDLDAVSAATTAAATRDVARRRRAELVTWLQPQLEPGTLLEVQDTAAPVPLLEVRRVTHRIGPAGATTTVAAWAAPGEDLLALLGDLLGSLLAGPAGAIGAALGALG